MMCNENSHMKKFNFADKELGVLRAFLKQDKLKIVVVGSFALYSIMDNTNIGNNLNIRFSDLDVDLYKSLYEKVSLSIYNDKYRNDKIWKLIDSHFDEITDEIESYSNVKEVQISIAADGLSFRPGNDTTIGGTLIFSIKDESDKNHHIKLDVNFENKDFQLENHKLKIENETYNVNTYTYEKMLADKYIAFVKHYKNAYADIINNNTNNSGNIAKLWKDIFDIIYIKNKVTDVKITSDYVDLMVHKIKYKPKLKLIDNFVNDVASKHPIISKDRNGWEIISDIIIKHKNVV